MRNLYLRGSFLLLFLCAFVSLKGRAQALNWPEAEEFGILSGKNIISSTSVLGYGSVGAIDNITSNVQATERLLANGQENVPAALAVLQDNINQCANLPGIAIDNQLSRQVLTAGVYSITSNAILDNSEYIELQGDSASVFIFNITGDLTLEALSRINIGDVRPGNIYWNVTGKIYIESGVLAFGVFMSNASIYKTGHNFGKAALFALENIELNLGTNLGVGHNGFYSLIEMLRGPGNPPAPYIPCSQPSPINTLYLNSLPYYPNLVLNNSFEEMVRCPRGFNTILDLTSDVCHWNAPANPAHTMGAGTSDYYNACNTIPFDMDVPNNSAGH